MTIANKDLFGEKRIAIAGNPKLEGIANHILELVGRDSTLLNGETVGEINRKVTLAVWFDDGLKAILTTNNSIDLFREWFMNPKTCNNEEEIARALRFLVERDYVRLPSKAIQNAEIHRQRIARSVR